jgi:tripartite-type tricarboxylate transporter receptor subunit TctC
MIAQRRTLLALPALALTPRHAAAQAFPARPIRLVVGAAAGGGNDTLMRLIAERMSSDLGQPVPVENRGGGGGAAAIAFLRAQPADGYTILSTQSSTWTLNPLQGQTNYRNDDFAFLAVVVRRSSGLMARADAPYKGWAEFVAWAKTRPSVSVATTALVHRLVMERVGRDLGVRFVNVASRGGSELRGFLHGGHVDVGVSGSVGFRDSRAGGPFQLLAVLDHERNGDYPDAPTLKDAGHAVAAQDHFAVAGLRALPAPIAERLSAAILRAAADETVRKFIDDGIGATPVSIGLDSARAVIERETEDMRQLLAGAS